MESTGAEKPECCGLDHRSLALQSAARSRHAEVIANLELIDQDKVKCLVWKISMTGSSSSEFSQWMEVDSLQHGDQKHSQLTPQDRTLHELAGVYECFDLLERVWPTAVGDSVVSTDEQHAGMRIGPYTLVQQIGQGGMGTVWEARQEKPIQRRLAIKLINVRTTTDSFTGRFEAEREILARMNHPNITRILDAGTTSDGQPYFCMELIEGSDILSYSVQQKLPLKAKLQLFQSVCSAVQHAHQKGVIHRDIKPSNVLVETRNDESVVKVIDFGLARILQANEFDMTREITHAGAILGSLWHMSPEQAGAESENIDTRTDVYLLGALLYQLLTGCPAIDRERLSKADLATILWAIRHDDPPRPSQRLVSRSLEKDMQSKELLDGLRSDLDWIVMRAIEKNPERRYATVAELSADVRRFINDEPIHARPPKLTYKLKKLFRQHRTASVGVLSVFVALVAGLMSTGLLWQTASREATRANEAAAAATTAEAKERVAKEDTNKVNNQLESTLARSKYFLATARADTLRIRDAHALLDSIPESKRFLEWYLAKQDLVGCEISCVGHTQPVLAVAYSPSGEVLASAAADRCVKLWDAHSGNEIRTLLDFDAPVHAVTFGMDGSLLVTGCEDGSTCLWSVTTGKRVSSFTDLNGAVQAVAFSTDGKQLISGGNDKTIAIRDLASGEVSRLEGHSAAVTDIACSPDGRWIASCGFDKTVRLWSAKTNQLVWVGKGHSHCVSSVAFDPQSNTVASSSHDNTLKTWSVETGQELEAFSTHIEYANTVSFNRQGTELVSGGDDSVIRFWNSSNGQQKKVYSGHLAPITELAISPDGTHAASASRDHSVRIWNISNQYASQMVRAHLDLPTAVDFSPDGSRMVTAGYDNAIKIWSTGDRKSIRSLCDDGVIFSCVRYQPDGRQLTGCRTDGLVFVWSVDEQQTVSAAKTFIAHDHATWMSYRANGKQFVTVGHDGFVKVWDSQSFEPVHSRKVHDQPVTSVAFSPDGQLVLSSDRSGMIRIWELETDTIRYETVRKSTPVLEAGAHVAFSSDGRLIGFENNENIEIRDTHGQLIQTLIGHTGGIPGIDIDWNSTRLISASYDGTVRLWDLQTGEELRAWRPFRDEKTNVIDGAALIRFRRDRRGFAAAEFTGKIRLWAVP